MQQKSEPKKPGIRIDGGKRRDFNKERIGGRMAALPKDAPTPKQTAARQKAMETRAKAERKAAKIGHEGAMISAVRIKVSGTRKTTQAFRSRPGTFEWQYGRNKQDVLFHAGSHFAQVWERAGMTVASSADFLRGTTSGYRTGISDGLVAAIDDLKGSQKALGEFSFSRLIDYCVLGLTSSEIARKHQCDGRAMRHVLHQDLRACAVHFHLLRYGAVA